jgi:dTMP kinase
MLVAIEGIDGSGKGTQAKLLLQRLVELGRPARLFSFPQYEHSFFGQEIGRYLNGHFGELNAVHPSLAALLYAGDRFEARDALGRLLGEGSVVVCDRYVGSNQAHQAAKLPPEERPAFFDWIEKLEYGVFGLPRPDLVIFLDLPPVIATELVHRKEARSYTDQAADIHEADWDYMRRVYGTYQQLAASHGWTRIPCVENGELRSAEAIRDAMWSEVAKRLP